jgi:16S rRNA C967 or C1407 C5-methylase (RsmB/RsmF family)
VQVEPVVQLPWYPDGNAYQLGTDRKTIRKSEALEQLHKWMIQHTDNGNITRQEAVSMVPPLALNVQSHHKCLDMCAAPGSKTTQMLEIINESLGKSDIKDQGLVVANDSDTDRFWIIISLLYELFTLTHFVCRAYMLVHQCRRLNSPLLIVTTHKGQEFPRLYPTGSNVRNVTNSRSAKLDTGVFDRVLCDVPCSGDGTMRKAPNIWSKWSTQGGLTLHPLQLTIAKRGLQLLKTNGLMVYSTCSMSPYGNCTEIVYCNI